MSGYRVVIVLFFVALALAQRLIEPAYVGYAVAFLLLALWQSLEPKSAQPIKNASPWWLPFGLWITLISTISIMNSPNARDVLRDIGAISAFFVGRYLFLYKTEFAKNLLRALSDVGVIVVAFTIIAACLAYTSGVGAYVWRGQFIPPSHAWLPYFLIINYALTTIDSKESKKYTRRIGWCVVGTLASLSRTDLVLELLFLLMLLKHNLPSLLTSRKIRRQLSYGLVVALLLTPLFLSLDVVQERINVGIDDGDQSVGWRLIENTAFLAMMGEATPLQLIFGFGFGTRIPLPFGVVDFNDNTTIPHLHNSFLTIIAKFGVIGLSIFLSYTSHLWLESHRKLTHELDALRTAGRWIILFVLLKAITLQGLTEWSHVMFFGIGCAFIASTKPKRSLKTSRSDTRLGDTP